MTSDGIATGADELKQKLAHQIDAARNRLEALKSDVISLHEDDMEMLRKKRDEIRARIDRQKDRLQQATTTSRAGRRRRSRTPTTRSRRGGSGASWRSWSTAPSAPRITRCAW